MKNCILIFLINYTALSSYAQVINFDLSAVPDTVRKNASVICRYENTVFEVSDLNSATYKVHQIVTVVNENGKDALIFNQGTSKYFQLDDVEIKVYDNKGKLQAKYKKRDMSTVATGEGLIEDGYVTYFVVSAPSYPVTVETKYEMKFRNTLTYPPFLIQTPGLGVETASFTARVPKEHDLRFKEKNIMIKPEVTEDSRYKIYKWTAKNLPPISREEGGSKFMNSYPAVFLSPNKFTYYGNEGDLSSWNNFGKWIADLYTGLDVLTEERKAFFRNLVRDAKSDREKASIIYDYLQKNFRYVSIQLGAGGLKPFSADFTDKKKYGDCKSLSNYMKAALAAAGVKSYVAIINAEYNDEPVDPDFPNNIMFNHVILCVPQPRDTIWLECTSSTAEFAKLGTFTENRYALLVTENGGVLVATPKSSSSDNRFFTSSQVELDESGSAITKTHLRGIGSYRNLLDEFVNEKADDKKETIVHYWEYKQPDEFAVEKLETDSFSNVNLTMSIEKICELKAGSKMFLKPRIYSISPGFLPKTEKRRLDYYFRQPFEKTDTTVFALPEGYIADALPKEKLLSCAYASYHSKSWYNEKEKAVYSSATLMLKQHRIPAASYAEVKKFFDEVKLDDSQRIVIKKE